MTKKIVKTSLGYYYISHDDFSGDIDDIIRRLEDKKFEARNEGYETVEISYDSGGRYYNYSRYDDDGCTFSAYGVRYETDEEEAKRESDNEKERTRAARKRKSAKVVQEKRERTLLETLKKKYEN